MNLKFWKRGKSDQRTIQEFQEKKSQVNDTHTAKIGEIKKSWNETPVNSEPQKIIEPIPEKKMEEKRTENEQMKLKEKIKTEHKNGNEETGEKPEDENADNGDKSTDQDMKEQETGMNTSNTIKKEPGSGYDTIYEHDKKERKTFRLKIIYNKKGCIGAGHCVLSDCYNFKLDKEFKADLVDGKEIPGSVKGVYMKEIETDEPHLIINAAKTCTPKVIGVIDMDTGKRIAP